MDHDYAQRRRVALAIAITVIAAPAAFLLNRSDPDAGSLAPGVTLVGTNPPAPGATPTATGPSDTGAMGTAPVGYLSGTTVPDQNEPARIAIPRVQASVRGDASFTSQIDETTRCHARHEVPFNATITITNLDNSRSVQCVASIGGPEPDEMVVMAPETFAEIADLTDAPVPVQITWADE